MSFLRLMNNFLTTVAIIALFQIADPQVNQLMGVRLTATGRADVFVMKDGRTLHGSIKSEKTLAGTKDKQYVVVIRSGAAMLINQREIKQHARGSKPEQEYAALMKHNKDSVEFHLALASWCHENSLTEHEVAHYERVIDLDSENAIARAGLKYAKGKDGRWIKRDVMMTEDRGKINVGGKYRFPEMVALEEAREKANEERVALMKDVRIWQSDVLSSTRRAADSRARLLALDGPVASTVLAELLFPKPGPGPRSDALRHEPLVMLYIEVLTRLADPTAVQTLIKLSMSDAPPSIRDKSLESLRKIAPRAATFAFMQHLGSDNPTEINKAARAILAMKDTVAVLSLIERVVTSHKRTSGGGANSNYQFDGGGGFTFGQAPPKTEIKPSQNADVLAALVELTGENFEYDRAAWLDWYSRTHLAPAGDLRRDP